MLIIFTIKVKDKNELIDTNVKVSTKFLTESAGPAEKEIWKLTYVTYLKITGK